MKPHMIMFHLMQINLKNVGKEMGMLLVVVSSLAGLKKG